jgi:orotate phosphoribosyltransferase
VVTTGASTIKAIERARAEGLNPIGAFTLVDRDEGGREAIEQTKVPVRSLFKRGDFP